MPSGGHRTKDDWLSPWHGEAAENLDGTTKLPKFSMRLVGSSTGNWRRALISQFYNLPYVCSSVCTALMRPNMLKRCAPNRRFHHQAFFLVITPCFGQLHCKKVTQNENIFLCFRMCTSMFLCFLTVQEDENKISRLSLNFEYHDVICMAPNLRKIDFLHFSALNSAGYESVEKQSHTASQAALCLGSSANGAGKCCKNRKRGTVRMLCCIFSNFFWEFGGLPTTDKVQFMIQDTTCRQGCLLFKVLFLFM